MAKTLTSIRMDFDRAIRKAQSLEELAQQLESLAEDNMEATFQNVGRAWNGEASRDYLGKGRELKRKIKSSAAQLKRIAEALRTAARVTYNAERHAILVAQARD